MGDQSLWKYCTREHCRKLLTEFQLFGEMNWSKERQIACLYALSNHIPGHYRTALIPKRDGTSRKLCIPDTLLKLVQRNILHHILDQLPASSYATAYRKGVTIVSNVSGHTGQEKILKLDIHDFFGSIPFIMVYQSVFHSERFPPAAGTLLTHLCCYNGCLPQGAPSSAAISNLVMKPFDEYMGSWCEKRGIIYTRYCDDMTFSGSFLAYKVKNKVRSFLRVIGFELNEKKTKLLLAGQRQAVTGIVVNVKPQVSKEYRRKLRQEVYYCLKYGAESHLQHMCAQDSGTKEAAGRYLQKLFGKINFVLQVNPEDEYFKEARERLIRNQIESEER